MQPRSLLLLLLLPCCALAQEDAGYLPAKAKSPEHHANERWSGGMGLAGGSMNFHQNGSVGFTFNGSYDLIRGKRSSLSLSQGLTIGTADEYGISLVPLLAVSLALGFVGYNGNDFDPSDGSRIAVYADFPLLLHYNFGAGATRRYSPEKERNHSEPRSGQYTTPYFSS
jgi:hypothetical protein